MSDLPDLPDSFWKAAIASGAIIPPPGPQIGPLERISVWLVLGAIVAGMCVLGFLYGLGTP